jgi:surface protein
METNERASVKMVIDLSDYQNVDNVVIVLKKSQEEQIKRVQPKTKKELKTLIDETIKEQGTACDLNFIDTSLITDMGELFYNSPFNGNISSWDVSNVTDMRYMFYNSPFNGNISSWDVSNVINMRYMFYDSEFNGNISSWNYRNDVNRENMFKK